MRRDKRAPALYELMRSRSKGGPFAPPGTLYRPTEVEPEETDDRLSWLSPGRVIRLPVGYLIVAALLILALSIGGYMIGYKKREREEARLREQDLRRQFDDVRDPLADPQGRSGAAGTVPSTGQPVLGSPERPPVASSSEPPPSALSGRPGRVTVVRQPGDDPREGGKNYLVAAQLALEEAQKAANFLAARGLEIAVVPVDNRSLTWHVVVVQGFGPGDWYGPGGKRLERDLQALGRQYKRDLKGPVDFSDAWWQKFK